MGIKIVAKNRAAYHNYFIEDSYEAGLKLVGSEIKSIRTGKVSIKEAYVTFKNNEAFITNMHISTYKQANRYNHDEIRPRKLLLHKKEISSLSVKSQQQGYSVIPLKLYLKRGLAKVEIGLAKGKKDYDKRHALKAKDQKRRMEKAMRDHQWVGLK